MSDGKTRRLKKPHGDAGGRPESQRGEDDLYSRRESPGDDPADNTETVGYDAQSTPRGLLAIHCLSCRSDFTVSADVPAAEVTCPTCSTPFNFEQRDEDTRVAEPLRTVGHFDLIERAGAGGFGSVWKARDRRLHRTVAIKIPRFAGLTVDEIDMALREARAVAQLQHPNIVRVYELIREGDSVYIVTDYVRGVTLREWLEAKRPTLDDAVRLATAVARALDHAHQNGVIHRDLKPANIMVAEGLEPKLMDFGLARREGCETTLTSEGQLMGTPAYMSPEQARGDGHTADGRTDVYSLGVVLYELLTGERPFRGNATMQIHQVLHDDPPPPRKLNAGIPRDLETIVLKCLEKNPASRYATAGALADDLEHFAAGRPISARPATTLGRVYRWYRRNPRSLAITAGAHMVLTSIVFMLWVVHGLLFLTIEGFKVEDPRWCLIEFAYLLFIAYPSPAVAGVATLNGKTWGLWLGGGLATLGIVLAYDAFLNAEPLVLRMELMRSLNGNRFAELQIISLLSLICLISLVLHAGALIVHYRSHD